MTDRERFEHETQPHKLTVGRYAEHLKIPDLEDMPNLAEAHSQQFAVKAAKGEELLLVEVLQEHLGRLVTADDFKDCQLKFRDGLPNGYIFAHKGIDLGVIKKEMKMDYDLGDFTKNVVSIQQIITFRKIKPV